MFDYLSCHPHYGLFRQRAILLLICTSFLQVGCRSRSRSSEIIGQAPVVNIQLRDIRQEDQRHPNFIYEAHQCGDGGPVVGKVTQEGEQANAIHVNFAIKGISLGDKCRIDVRIASLAAFEHQVRFTDRELLMYRADEVTIRQDIYGKFIGTATLQRKYFFERPEPEQKTFAITVPLKFPEPMSQVASSLDGNITCEPSLFPVDSMVTVTNNNSAELTINSLIREGQDHSYECRRISLFVDNQFSYFANLSGSSRFKFTAVAGKSIKLSEEPITMVVVEPPPLEGVIVDTEGATCPEGQVFNTVRRECVDPQ